MRSFSRTGGVLAAVLTLVLSGCGGGGGSSSPPPPPPAQTQNPDVALTLSTTNVSVSATTNDPAPTAMVTVDVTPHPPAGTVIYILEQHTTHGISSIAGSGNGPLVATITFDAPSALGAGTYDDTLSISACFDQACTQPVHDSPQSIAVAYTVTQATPPPPPPPTPTLTAITPRGTTAGLAGLTLTATGSGFDAQTILTWNGVSLPVTSVSATQITASVSAAQVANAGDYQVTAVEPGGAPSQGITFTVAPPAALQLNSVSPITVTAGGAAFNLTVLGQGFGPNSVVQWNGGARNTTLVSATELLAQIPAGDIAATGSASVTVTNTPSGGTSNALTVAISAASKDAVSYQINAAHTGSVSFNGVSLPSTSTWSVNVGGLPSYALIVGGRVFVTVLVNGNSQLLALDAATGATLWGPIGLTGPANAGYDAGTLFVVNGPGVSSQIITAYDPATGSSKWSSTVNGGWFPAPPVAAQGIVYAKNAGLISAFSQASGATLWTMDVSGTAGTVALAVDSVYASAPCTTFALRPPTGEVIWSNNTGCEGGGGDTPVVADGVLYSAINGKYSGLAFNPANGQLLGSFPNASTLPALNSSGAFFLNGSTLQGVTRSNNTIAWSFAGDGALATAPIVVNNYVFVGSNNGVIYALDATSGSQLWSKSLGAAIPYDQDGGVSQYSGLSAGDGLLVVPAGDTVTAYTLSTSP